MRKRFNGGKNPPRNTKDDEPRRRTTVKSSGRQVAIIYGYSEPSVSESAGAIEHALRLLKRGVHKARIFKEAEDRKNLVTPSEKRRHAKIAAIQREKRRQKADKPKRYPLRGK